MKLVLEIRLIDITQSGMSLYFIFHEIQSNKKYLGVFLYFQSYVNYHKFTKGQTFSNSEKNRINSNSNFGNSFWI